MCCLHFTRPERFKYIAAHHPMGDAGRAEGNQQGRLTHSHLTSPQVPDAVQTRGKEGRKGNPLLASGQQGISQALLRPSHCQATVMGKGKWTQSHDFFIRSYTSFSAWHQQQCRTVCYMLHTSIAANMSRHHPNQDKLVHGCHCKPYQLQFPARTIVSDAIREPVTPRKLLRPLQYLTFNGPEKWQATSPHSNPKTA